MTCDKCGDPGCREVTYHLESTQDGEDCGRCGHTPAVAALVTDPLPELPPEMANGRLPVCARCLAEWAEVDPATVRNWQSLSN